MSHERTVRRIWYRCVYRNEHCVQCDDGATHEVIAGPVIMGRFCEVHAECVRRDGCDGYGFARTRHGMLKRVRVPGAK